MKYIIEIRNPRRPVEYVGTRGYSANKLYAKSFDDVSEVDAATSLLQEFSHLEDQFFCVVLH